MITCKTKKWGNSLGIIIPNDQVKLLHLEEEQEVMVEITKAINPLKELFGFGKNNKITRKEFLETRKLLEPRM
ncbi:hypothetical protein A2642_02435 [Candidatus Nomurabacteria bacterium RIFCSPHIGHO2_01_FULL_39_10]|uniref:SpoVT-AbrB domain-containing protein n=1 Tax=Candidatus Nomurabacteria bacterium RIFCSPHIGHO2_01_FULL_39_10 TaxID=1801733 RepID=A0A1F6V5N6_9BACT|nr:MAG: hypothetical protein A2642_02435 [Candidatus Nomurabacteria bacterium RIFCSPHIGHO2_01_FULL_39_10]